MIAQALLDLPVIVQGSLWQHIDFRGRKAQLIDGQDFGATKNVYSDQLGIIDMSANVDSWPHDRVQRAAGSFALVLTNRQGWLTENFPNFDDLTYEFEPASITARISDTISNPDRYLDLGVAFGEQFSDRYTRGAFAHFVVDMAELAAMRWSVQKPVIQNFFVWPALQSMR
jgi:hypothetical protein